MDNKKGSVFSSLAFQGVAWKLGFGRLEKARDQSERDI